MSGMPSISGSGDPSDTTRTASSFQFIYDQIQALRRQTDAGVARGALSTAFGAETGSRLSAIEMSVEAGVSDRSMNRADLRRVHEDLQEIRKSIVQARRAAVEEARSAAPSSGDPDQTPPRALDISV